jgi:hypothetical protein
MKWILNIVFCFAISQIVAQHKYVLEITCLDLTSNNAVQNASITCLQGDSTKTLKTNREGKIYWNINQLTALDVTINHGYYETKVQKLILPKGANEGDTIRKK